MSELIARLRAAAENELKGHLMARYFLWLAEQLEKQELQG